MINPNDSDRLTLVRWQESREHDDRIRAAARRFAAALDRAQDLGYALRPDPTAKKSDPLFGPYLLAPTSAYTSARNLFGLTIEQVEERLDALENGADA